MPIDQNFMKDRGGQLLNSISEADIMKGRKLPELRNLPQSNRLFDDAANEHNLELIKLDCIQTARETIRLVSDLDQEYPVDVLVDHLNVADLEKEKFEGFLEGA